MAHAPEGTCKSGGQTVEGNRPIVLRRPVSPAYDKAGRLVAQAPAEATAYARVYDRGGHEFYRNHAVGAEWDRRFVLRRDGLEALSNDWHLVYEGQVYDIVSVAAIDRDRRWQIDAVYSTLEHSAEGGKKTIEP